MTRLVVLAAGGTAGHLFPAAALGGELRVRGWGVVLITDRRGAENAAQAFFRDVTTYVVRSGTPAGRNLFAAAWVIMQLLVGIWQAWWLLLRLRPTLVVGFGGYPTLPIMWAALQRGIPTLIHEQNAVLGRVNRLVANRVAGIALSYPDTARLPTSAPGEIAITGNPVREEIRRGRERVYQVAKRDGVFRLLIIGGSQGANIFGEVVPDAITSLSDPLRRRLQVSQQCRPEDRERIVSVYRNHEIAAACETFFVDIADRMVRSHLVITRAGASSVAELACVGRPAILVPLPHAADDHQAANARALAGGGAAILLLQGDQFSADALAKLLARFMADPEALAAMAGKAQAQGRADGEAALADFAERIAGPRAQAAEAGK